MHSLPPRLIVCVLGTSALALVVSAAAALHSPPPLDGGLILRSALLASLVLAARLFPMQAGAKTKTTLATAPLFAAALVLPIPLAIAVGGASALIAEVIRRVPWPQVSFNTSEAMLRVASGAIAVALLVDRRGLPGQPTRAWLVAAPLAALVMYAVNVTAVEGIVGVQMRRLPLPGFWRRRRGDVPLEASLMLVGVVVAALTGTTVWVIPALGTLIVIMHHLQRRPIPAGASEATGRT